jgi:hypothetical protein
MTPISSPVPDPPYRSGDVLRISCPFTETTVTHLTSFYVSVRWPWNRVDPDAERIRWNGSRAIATDPSSFDGMQDLYTLEPGLPELADGDTCRVGIPPTIVHVIDVTHFEPPLVTGWLPRPRRLLTVLKAGQSEEPGFDDQGLSIDPDGEVPFDIDLLLRPYDFLDIGDEIADANGRAWTFHGPWNWQPFDALPGTDPAWPLTLLHRAGTAQEVAAAHVAGATASGSHDAVLSQWRELAGADPVPAKGLASNPEGDRPA